LGGIYLCLGSFTMYFFLIAPRVWCMNFMRFFILNDSASGFNLFFKVCGHIVQSHVPPSMLRFLSTSWLLALENGLNAYVPLRSMKLPIV
jgi:hypothetical protein